MEDPAPTSRGVRTALDASASSQTPIRPALVRALLAVSAVALAACCVGCSAKPDLHVVGNDPTMVADAFAHKIVERENSKAGTYTWRPIRVSETPRSWSEAPTGGQQRGFEVVTSGAPLSPKSPTAEEDVRVSIVQRSGSLQWRVDSWTESSAWGEE